MVGGGNDGADDDHDKHSAQRDEIKLYMDKLFQASFGYFAALLALLAISKTSLSTDIAEIIKLDASEFLSIAILLTNWAYIILVCSCSFAIQKRVFFILCTGPSSDCEWEVFSQNPSKFRAGSFGLISGWGIDRYAISPVLMIILAITVTAFYVLIHSLVSCHEYIKYTAVFLLALYTVPIWMMVCMIRIGSECKRRVDLLVTSPQTGR